MKKLLFIPLIALASCATSKLSEESNIFSFLGEDVETEKYNARITYYSIGEDKWGDKVACPNTHRAKEGITIAAHPQFPFGTVVYIPKLKEVIDNGMFTVQDRGSAVTKKKAAKGKAFVFDVFVSNQHKMRKHAYNRDMYMDVYVPKNN